MMRKVATNRVRSDFSLHYRKGKESFVRLALYTAITSKFFSAARRGGQEDGEVTPLGLMYFQFQGSNFDV